MLTFINCVLLRVGFFFFFFLGGGGEGRILNALENMLFTFSHNINVNKRCYFLTLDAITNND